MKLQNKIYAMDATELLSNIPDGCIDLIITSPPYDDIRTYDNYTGTFDFKTIANESYRVLKPGGVLVWIVSDQVKKYSETLTSFRQALYFVDTVGFIVHDTMIHYNPGCRFPDKTRYNQCHQYMFVLSKGRPKTKNLQTKENKWITNGITTQREPDGTLTTKIAKPHKRGVMDNVWKINQGYMKTTKDKIAYQHPAMFGEAIAERHILSWSNEGDLVLDYFMGAGTTAKMAMLNNRYYLGCDISQTYVDLAYERLAIHENNIQSE